MTDRPGRGETPLVERATAPSAVARSRELRAVLAVAGTRRRIFD